MKPEKSVFTLVGDVVESRQAADRQLLQRQIRSTADRMNELLKPQVPFGATIGDEFQACFDDVAAAVRASLMFRLDLLREAGVDTRCGLGVGPVENFADDRHFSQDGPGWWKAREAIIEAEHMAASPNTAFVRTWFTSHREGLDDPFVEGPPINAYLLCRDALVERMKQLTRNRLLGLMRGLSQSEIAKEEGATQGAISQSLGTSGAFAILAAQRQLEERRS